MGTPADFSTPAFAPMIPDASGSAGTASGRRRRGAIQAKPTPRPAGREATAKAAEGLRSEAQAPAEAPGGRAPSEVPALPRTGAPSAAVGAPAVRGKGGRTAAGKGAAPGTPKGPFRVAFAHHTSFQYRASAMKSGESAARPNACRGARSVDEFFYIQPGSATAARRDLGWDLSEGL